MKRRDATATLVAVVLLPFAIAAAGDLTFRAAYAHPRPDTTVYAQPSSVGESRSIHVSSEVLLRGDCIAGARLESTDEGDCHILVTFTDRGAVQFGDLTAAMIDRRLAIMLDDTLLSAPVVRERITGGRAVITGQLSHSQAEAILRRLNASPARGTRFSTGDVWQSPGLVVSVGQQATTRLRSAKRPAAQVAQALLWAPGEAKALRQALADEGELGTMTVASWDAGGLPYVDATVNRLIVDEEIRIDEAEVRRVLAPRGQAFRLDGKALARWIVKPVPPELDEWTHFLHGPDGHVMSEDTHVGPPYHIQWIGSPRHARSHTHLTPVNVMVTSGGRLFYIADETPPALPNVLASRWVLVARDAFNGIELWRRPLKRWQPYFVKDRNSYPADLHRRLVADGDTVYATLDIYGPVSALDAATGDTLRTYGGTERAEDIVVADGRVYVSSNTDEEASIDRLQMAYRHVEPRQKRLAVYAADSVRLLWERTDVTTLGLMPMSLAVRGERLCYQTEAGITCRSSATGDILWAADRPSEYFRPGWSSPTLVVLDDVVISADRQSGPGHRVGKDRYAAGGFSTGDLVVFEAATGKRLWTAPCAEGCRAPTDVFVADRKLYFGRSLERKVHEYRHAHSLLTGEVLSEAPVDPAWPNWHHHRCYRDKATTRFIMAGRTGIEFIDLATGDVSLHNWVRGNCKFGIMPANGLIYLPPEQCGCYIESKLTGFHALAPRRAMPAPEHPLERGTASAPSPSAAAETDWPTFRADTSRSGRARCGVPADPEPAWRAPIGGHLTQPVVAGSRLLVAAVDSHTIHALDAATGRPAWTFAAGGRVDSPPTVSDGLAVFGCRDGWVYALTVTDGTLVWRFRAAPGDRSLLANGHLESVWPVHGSVLVRDGSVYCAAGRSSYVDGGIYMHRLDLATGEAQTSRCFYSRDPETGDTVELYPRFSKSGYLRRMDMPGVLPDVLSAGGDAIWMRGTTFTADLELAGEYSPHLFGSMGFLDDSWWELTYWIYGPHMFGGRAGVAEASRRYPAGRIMVCGRDRVYAWQDGYETMKTPGLVACSKTPEVVPVRRGRRKSSKVVYDWRVDAPIHAFGMILAGNSLVLAGPPRVDAAETRQLAAQRALDTYGLPQTLARAHETFHGNGPGRLCIARTEDGSIATMVNLPSTPVFDGLIAARGRLYLSLRDGSVLCMAADDE